MRRYLNSDRFAIIKGAVFFSEVGTYASNVRLNNYKYMSFGVRVASASSTSSIGFTRLSAVMRSADVNCRLLGDEHEVRVWGVTRTSTG